MAESYENPNFNNQNFQNYYPTPPIQELRVGFGKRFGAYLVDFLIILLLGGILSAVVPIKETSLWKNTQEQFDAERQKLEDQGRSEEEIEMGMKFAEGAAMIGIIASFVALLYSLVELFTGASPAKHMFGIIAAHANGAPGNLPLWGARWFIKTSGSILSVIGVLTAVELFGTIGTILSVVIFIGCFFALGQEKQALHDKIAKTAVFHKEDVANMQADYPTTA